MTRTHLADAAGADGARSSTSYVRPPGDLLIMDAPEAKTWQELCSMAMQREEWRKHVEAIKIGKKKSWRTPMTTPAPSIGRSTMTQPRLRKYILNTAEG